MVSCFHQWAPQITASYSAFNEKIAPFRILKKQKIGSEKLTLGDYSITYGILIKKFQLNKKNDSSDLILKVDSLKTKISYLNIFDQKFIGLLFIDFQNCQ